MKILFVSLGCDKNLVDTEVMLGMLTGKGYSITDDEKERSDQSTDRNRLSGTAL